MRLILAVFDALRTFDRPCTRAELQRESGLDKDEVHLGLRGLDRRHMLAVEGNPRSRGLYQLTPEAKRPEDLRGKYVRAAEHRAQASIARRAHRPARPAMTAAVAALAPRAPAAGGCVRAVVRHGIGLTGGNTPIAPCALAQAWRRR